MMLDETSPLLVNDPLPAASTRDGAGNNERRSADLVFQTPDSSLTLYAGTVMHHRLKPKKHRFTYRVYSLLMDLDRQHEIDQLSPLLSHNRWNLFSIHDKDHGPATGEPLRAWVERLLSDAGMQTMPARILLLCYPRIFGAVFNPLSVFYAYDARGVLMAVIYEVRNTFGERHSYVAPVKPGELSRSGLRQTRAKLFYVSPLMDMDLRYHFHLKPPTDQVAVRILETDIDGAILTATFHGTAVAVSTASLLAQAIRVPFQTFKVIGAIHYEALRLWLKGIKLRHRPPAPPKHSVQDGVLTGAHGRANAETDKTAQKKAVIGA